MSDFVYLALTLLSFAGLALLVGIVDARLKPDPDSTETDPAETDRAETGPTETALSETAATETGARAAVRG